MSSVKRLFQSAPMNPASGTSGSPSGVAGGATFPAVPKGVAGAATFPAIAAGGGLLVANDGSVPLRLWFADGTSQAPTLSQAQLAAEGTGTLIIPAGKFVILTTIVAGCGVTYSGGAWSIVPGSFSYSVECDPADHPAATVGL